MNQHMIMSGLLSLLLSVSAFAQNPAWTTFTPADGLADNRVNAIAKDSAGVLWFGTHGGVSRYDGQSWTSFTTADGLPDNWVNAIIEDSNGALWFGTFGGGVSRYDGQSWTTFTTGNGLAYNYVLAIVEDRSGALWFGTRGGVSRYDGQRWTTFTTADGLANNRVNAIIEDRGGALWFGTYAGGVSRYDGQSWTTFTTIDGLASNYVVAIIEDRAGALWFGTFGSGVSRYDGQIWTTFTTADGLVSDYVQAIIEDRAGALWFGTGERGVSRYDGQRWTTFTTADGLASNYVFAIVEDRAGALWFGTAGGGVSRYDGQRWTTFTTADGLANNDVFAIVEDRAGALWFGTRGGGVSRYDSQSWTTFTTADGLANNGVFAIVEDRAGALWFGTRSGGVSRYDGQSWTTFTNIDGLASNYVEAIIEDRAGALWFGTIDGGVSRYDGQSWTTFVPSDGLPNNNVSVIVEDSAGALWFGTYGGVTRVQDHTSPRVNFLIRPETLTGNISPLFIYSGRDDVTRADRLLFAWELQGEGLFIPFGEWSIETSVTLPPLADGVSTFTVKAKDLFGKVTARPPRYTFRVDATPPTVNIISPKPKEVIAGNVAVLGSAFDTSFRSDFIEYQVEYGTGSELNEVANWESISSRQDTVRNDTLAMWNTSNLKNGLYWLKLSARDSLGHESEDVIQVDVVKSTNHIRPSDGALLSVDAGQIELFIPPKALAQEEQVNIKECETVKRLNGPDITFTNFCFEITSDREIVFAKPVTMTIKYPDFSGQNINEQKLAVYHLPTGQSNWVRLGGSVSTNESKITTRFTQLGVFALYEDLTAGNESGISAVAIHPRVFTPNSAGLRSKVDISYTLGQDGEVTCKVYNTAGRLIAIIEESAPKNHGENVASWHGRDLQGKTCPSGLYVVTIQAGGEVKTKTVAVMNKIR